MNGTLLEIASCFTYLQIISTSLRPMMIKGGASYILRGYGQDVYLQPSIFSIDPDDPEVKVYVCVCVWSMRAQIVSIKYWDRYQQF